MFNQVYTGDVLDFAALLPPQSVQTIVTSPPYFGLRSYLDADHPDKAREIGGEPTPAAFVATLVAVFRALWPALKDDGTCWVNLGDSYNGGGGFAPNAPSNRDGNDRNGAGRSKEFSSAARKGYADLKPKDLIGIPWRVALALQADGWWLRSDIVWHKPNPMPESVTDRPTRSHEYIFLLTKSERYVYDHEAIKEPISASSIARISQANFANQTGGEKDYGTTGVNPNRSMRKTLENFAAKQDGHGRRYEGFNERYDFDNPPAGRNKRDVWIVPTAQFASAHYATFPPELIRPCILAGSRPGDVVCEPFCGSGTTPMVAVQERRQWVACDLDARSVGWTAARLAGAQTRLGLGAA